jgi:hypothetical protein
MIESYRGEKAFFIGNGINRAENNHGISWIDLLRKISTKYGINTDLTNELKPFPLMFEEMLYAKSGRNNFQNKLRNLKRAISEILADDADRLIDYEIHKGLMQCGINEIITTNYDYNLEVSMIPNFIDIKSRYSINNLESKHSLYRGYNIKGVNIRHIHGELRHNRKITRSDENYPEESIMIGFEHYSDYFTRIHNVIKGESGKHKDEEKKSLLTRIRDNQTGKIWTDLFFTHQLIFAGFSLDFSENHLWWLLLQREELKRGSNKYDIKINNEIVFCVPQMPINPFAYQIATEEQFNNLYKKKLDLQKNSGVADVLSSLKVKINSVTCYTYREFYLKVIEQYSKNNS